MSEPIIIIGATGSPYTRKMVALLRCRRIPYRVIWGDPGEILSQYSLPKPKVSLLPTVLLPTAPGKFDVLIDSTPIIRTLEAEHTGRSVIPSDPAIAFINYLLEDFADEWCTKYMFHYRWHFAEDADNASSVLPLAMNVCHAPEQLAFLKTAFANRQISRLGVVGSSPETASVIEASFERMLVKLDAVLAETPYLLGHRPSSADFALYGQLTQLIGFEETSRKIAHKVALRTVAWMGLMEDLSGIEMEDRGWIHPSAIPNALIELLREVGSMYVPALTANAAALEAGQSSWCANISGASWQQQSFAYQGKCLMWIRQEFKALPDEAKEIASNILRETGCFDLVSEN